MAKKESIMEEGLEARYEKYRCILKDLTWVNGYEYPEYWAGF